MKEKDFSGADLPFPLFSLEASVQLDFQTLIEEQKSSKECPLLLFLSSIQPQTLLFTQPTKFYPSRQRTLTRIRGLKIQIGGILQVRKWLFDNYLLPDRLEDNQSIKQIQKLGVKPHVTSKHAKSLKKWGKPLYCFFQNFFSAKKAFFAKNLYIFKRNKKGVRGLHTSVISEKR